MSKQLTGSIENDILFVKSILPPHYKITWGDNRKRSTDKITSYYLRCVSEKGIEVEEIWKTVFEGFKEHFEERFLEVYHNTCTKHVDFLIYFRPTKKP